MSSESGSSDVSLPSTPATSQPPSPALSKLSLQDITDEAKAEAASFKAEANKAFVCAYLVFRVVRVWVVMTSFDLILDTRYVCEPCICGFVRGLWSARECSTRLQQGGGTVHEGH